MKSYLPKLIFFLLLITFIIPQTAEALVVRLRNPLEYENFWDLLTRIIDFIFILGVSIAPIMFLVAGFYFITAAGDPEKITTAKKMVLWVLVGLLIIFSAKGLIELLADILGFEIPT